VSSRRPRRRTTTSCSPTSRARTPPGPGRSPASAASRRWAVIGRARTDLSQRSAGRPGKAAWRWWHLSANIIVGTASADYIEARGGNDKIYARAGNDEIRAGKGADRAHGGAGNDDVVGGDGSDWLFAGCPGGTCSAGSNVIFGGSGNDVVGAGNGKYDNVNCSTGSADVAYVDSIDDWTSCEIRHIDGNE
jgi:hypothetical protein